MARVLVSFLGNNRYCPCNYHFPGIDSNGTVQFVQEELAKVICRDWGEQDRVLILLTKEAEEGNWSCPGEGLEARLAEIQQGAKWELRPLKGLPAGFTPAELWTIFQRLLDTLNDGDEVWFDVTHGFRTLPMVALLFFGYARLVKRIQPKAILYGAFEEKGPMTPAEREGRAVRDANVYDVVSLVTLMEWTEAVTAFLRFGYADDISSLAKAERGKWFRQAPNSPDFQAVAALEALAGSLKLLTEDLRAARGKRLLEFDQMEALQKRLAAAKAATRQIPPLGALLDGIENVVGRFRPDDWRNGIEAARWCVAHELIPQAYTLLQETLFSMVLKKAGFPYDQEKWRVAAAYALFSAGKKQDGSDFDAEDEAHRGGYIKIREIVGTLPSELIQACASLRDHRNDINHGGYLSDAAQAQRLLTRVKTLLDTVDGSLGLQSAGSRRMPLVFSHVPTSEQEREARERWRVEGLVPLPADLQDLWSQVAPDEPAPWPALDPVVRWALENSAPGGPVLVQGDFGATAYAVRRLQEEGRVPVYATTRREAVDETAQDGSVRTVHVFRHAGFRAYPE